MLTCFLSFAVAKVDTILELPKLSQEKIDKNIHFSSLVYVYVLIMRGIRLKYFFLFFVFCVNVVFRLSLHTHYII